MVKLKLKIKMSYELYDMLAQRVREKNEKNLEIDKLCLTINSIASMDKKSMAEHYEELKALMLHHESIKNKGVLLTKITNGGVEQPGGRGIQYIFNNIKDIQLKQIFNEYIIYYSS